MDIVEWVQGLQLGWWGLEPLPCEKRLWHQGWFSWEKVASGGPKSVASTNRRGRRDAVRLCTVMGGRKLKGIKTNFNMRASGWKEEAFSAGGQPSSETGCPEVLYHFHSWSFSRLSWRKLWANLSEFRINPAMKRRLCCRPPKVDPSNWNYLMILREFTKKINDHGYFCSSIIPVTKLFKLSIFSWIFCATYSL